MVSKPEKNVQILIVDDEPLIRKSLYEIMRIEGYRVQMAETGEAALGILKKEHIDVVVTDFQLPKMTGIQLLEEVKRWSPKTEVILITGYGTIESAVAAMKKGAFDYITKPINDTEIKIIIQKLIERKQIVAENEELKQIIAKGRRDHFCDLIGVSARIQEVYRIIDSVASSNATILITGESGTGKGLIARAIRQTDQTRKDKPFVEISCGALTETLLESELFGHMKGAFTGAIKDKEGRFEYARGGTIFLDEIDAFSPTLQVKLLRVLQEGIFERVGDNIPRRAEARIIVATNQNLTDLVRQGKFREDLYYRINVICVQVPPLRDRKEDIPILAGHFLKKYCAINNKKITGMSGDVQKMFSEYSWPGNIRELENAIEGAVIMAKAGIVNRADIPNFTKFTIAPPKFLKSPEKNLKRAVEQPEKEHIISILKDCNWNRNKSAASLGVNRTTLYNKMKKYNISEETI
ncbi:MAG: sigma-54-dependent Fis family transcriptional regulator [Candidatus Omnitrophica bacterium]|nr:sigma-54-dependent Fis family transcriptional regulator [Candidatus Omnitrophota bacterium]